MPKMMMVTPKSTKTINSRRLRIYVARPIRGQRASDYLFSVTSSKR